ncbi:alpha/beta fold hydrolase [Actinomadura kijaniata]|uniref:alpha/beta fold hydrolase n=1 Tax=Actinomadura kijaniata TaxID=46161 RepID=UPI00082FDFBA|nr:alpha/beta fold hydrolase [Actinomadura kijaniata]
MGREPLRRAWPTLDGAVTPVVAAGPEDAAEAVVFVHGSPGSAEDWADLVGRVGAHARAVAPTMPGFARAGIPDGFDHSAAAYADRLDRVLGEIGVERAHLVLHDFGGLWGLTWAARDPGRVAGLTLVNTGCMIGYRWHALARAWRTPLLGELVMRTTTRGVFGRLLRRGPRPLPAAFVRRTYDDFDRGTRDTVLRLYRGAGDVSEASARLRRPLRAHRYPVQVIWGARDPYLPVRYAHLQREVFPRAQVAVLPFSGHWPFADDPEGVAGTLVPFVARTMSFSVRTGP